MTIHLFVNFLANFHDKHPAKNFEKLDFCYDVTNSSGSHVISKKHVLLI